MTGEKSSLSDMLSVRERVILLNYLEDDILPELEDKFHCDEKCNDQNEMKITANKIEELEKITEKLGQFQQFHYANLFDGTKEEAETKGCSSR